MEVKVKYLSSPKTTNRVAKLCATFLLVCMLAICSQAFATVTIQSQIQLKGYDFYGQAILDVIDESDNLTSYESDLAGIFNVQLNEPGKYDLNIRHNSGDFEWLQYFSIKMTEGINVISTDPLYLNYNPDNVILVPDDYTSIQDAVNAIQSGGWVIVSAQTNPYAINGLHWENKHVKLLGQPGAKLTLGYGDTSHAVHLSWGGINRTDLISGFILENCQIGAGNGPAISLSHGASPTIQNCEFRYNVIQNNTFVDPDSYGGAVYIEGATNQSQSPFFYNCIFDDNQALNVRGGGAVAIFGPVEFLSCTFSNNWTELATGRYIEYCGAGGAILIISEGHQGDIIFDNCTFSENHAAYEADDISISKCSEIEAIRIENCKFDPSDHLHTCIGIFSNCYTQACATELHIQGNRFNLDSGGAVHFHDRYGTTPMWFNNNTVIGGYNGLDVKVINQGSDLCFDNNTLRNLGGSGLILFEGYSYTINNNVFDNCFSYDIKWGGSYSHPPTQSLTINNCYFNDLNSHVDTTGNGYQIYVANDLLVAPSPELGANQEPLWNDTVRSPLIDRGVSSMFDPDGTPSDIGALRAIDHKYEEYTMPHSNSTNIKWMSFPVLNRTTNGYTTNSNFFDQIIDSTILDWVDWKVEDGFQIRMDYLDMSLTNGDKTVASPVGYKVQLKNSVVDEIKIKTTGHIEYPTTALQLYKYLNGTTTINENWLGYFLPESTTPFEAFSPVLEHLTWIQTQNWCMSKAASGFWRMNSTNPTLNYGDMVIVRVSQDCSFTWNNSKPVTPKYVKPSQNFDYIEKPDYIPLYIEFAEDQSLELPCEIGLYVDGICKGATVVEGPNVQICAYLNSNEQISPENSELVFWYDSKAQSSNRISCKLSSGTLAQNRDFENLHYSFVVSDKTELEPVIPLTQLSQNYPNPFNPSTTIAYELAEAGLVSMEIYNVKGQRVSTLLNGKMAAGAHHVLWNGCDKYGRALSSGIYYCRLITKDQSISKKMILLK